jgi:hypothetical protein
VNISTMRTHSTFCYKSLYKKSRKKDLKSEWAKGECRGQWENGNGLPICQYLKVVGLHISCIYIGVLRN